MGSFDTSQLLPFLFFPLPHSCLTFPTRLCLSSRIHPRARAHTDTHRRILNNKIVPVLFAFLLVTSTSLSAESTAAEYLALPRAPSSTNVDPAQGAFFTLYRERLRALKWPPKRLAASRGDQLWCCQRIDGCLNRGYTLTLSLLLMLWRGRKRWGWRGWKQWGPMIWKLSSLNSVTFDARCCACEIAALLREKLPQPSDT